MKAYYIFLVYKFVQICTLEECTNLYTLKCCEHPGLYQSVSITVNGMHTHLGVYSSSFQASITVIHLHMFL